ncbi:hypothetical protein R1flu_020232 [Riccia fluitans]|uniref:Uncharacterized protein n=1 Tax=Riccia fluitans TaxID=41844 RepID=A0ABD1ZPG0_9MARC
MASCSSRNLKTKEVKIPHLTIANKRKMENWVLGGLFAVDWNGTYENLVEELADRKVAVHKYEYRGKPEEWTSDVWRVVYNLPKAYPRGYTMKEKVQFAELQLLRVVKGDFRQSKSGVFLEQVKGSSDFVLFCQMLNVICTHGCLEKEDSKKRKALIETISDSKTETEDEKEPTEEVPRTFCEGKASGSKPFAHKITVDYDDWGIHLESLGRETSKLFEAFHVKVGSVTAEAMARNMKEIFAPPLVVEVDIQPWREMVKNMIKLLTDEQKKNKEIVEQRDYYEGKIHCLEKVPKIAMWCAQQLQASRDTSCH